MSRGAPLRADIQALRGYAVSLVIAYHAGLGLAPGGFLGVDIFFVVSGFLIGGGVLRGLAGGTFRFSGFYLRRIRRLAPAAYAVLLVTTAVAAWLLTPSAEARFMPQALGALSYTTNIVLWRQINYFNSSAATEPLLHMWSLAIEEQFYLLLPLALWLTPRRLRAAGVVAVTLGSLAVYVWLYPRTPGAGFYLLPTRAWELGLGTVAALLAGRVPGLACTTLWPGLAVLVVVPLVPLPWVPPHLLALPACAATALLLCGMARQAPLLAPLARVGDASYSLYLVHWPLFAFAHTLWLGQALPPAVSLGLVGLTALLGAALYRWVELPGRWTAIAPRRALLAYIGATLALAALVAGTAAVVRARGETVDLSGVTGLGLPGCSAEATDFDGRCRRSPAPDMLVWGDSFSQQIVPALEASGAARLVQASKGQCAPLLGMAPLDQDATRPFAEGCLAFNRSVIAWLARAPQVRVVVLSGYYERYAQSGTLALRDGVSRPAPATQADLLAAQRRTVSTLRALGKRVVVVTGPRQAGFDVGLCWERKLAGLPAMDPAPDCAITPAGAARSADWSEHLYTAFAADVPVVRLDHLLCPDASRCETRLQDVPLYRDPNHLSQRGTRLAGRLLDLNARVLAAAR
ncbi:MAG: acyltransferase [Sphingomonadales bacterium]|nr:acyltransferase [Sphingomonadales bacterium]